MVLSIIQWNARSLIANSSVRYDREGQHGGGCITFVKKSIAFRRVTAKVNYECVVIEVFSHQACITVVNICNPCSNLKSTVFDEILVHRKRHGVETLMLTIVCEGVIILIKMVK